jgi:hypothetical protein
MGRPVIDPQGHGAPANVDAYRFPGEGLLKYSLAQITREEKAIRVSAPQSSKEPELGNTHVLGLIDDHKVEWRM